jgi:hypothetical protein
LTCQIAKRKFSFKGGIGWEVSQPGWSRVVFSACVELSCCFLSARLFPWIERGFFTSDRFPELFSPPSCFFASRRFAIE